MLAIFIAAHGALGWAYFYSFSKGLEPIHDAAAEHIPRSCAALDLQDRRNGETKNASHRDAQGPKRIKHEDAEERRSTTMNFATKTIHAGQPSEPETGSLIAPIFQTSTFEQDAPGQDKGFNYSRTNNPTRKIGRAHV